MIKSKYENARVALAVMTACNIGREVSEANDINELGLEVEPEYLAFITRGAIEAPEGMR